MYYRKQRNGEIPTIVAVLGTSRLPKGRLYKRCQIDLSMMYKMLRVIYHAHGFCASHTTQQSVMQACKHVAVLAGKNKSFCSSKVPWSRPFSWLDDLPSFQLFDWLWMVAEYWWNLMNMYPNSAWYIIMGVSLNSGFPPQIIHFKRDFHYKSSILGYPPIFGNTLTDLIFFTSTLTGRPEHRSIICSWKNQTRQRVEKWIEITWKTYLKFNIAPWKVTIPTGKSYSNHPFSPGRAVKLREGI